MKKSILLLLFFVNLNAQSVTVKVLDSLSFSPIPFATVYFSNSSGIISDENGDFELIKNELTDEDSLFISSMGYNKISFSLNQFKDSIVFLSPKPIELNNVILTNRDLSSEEIIEKVKAGLTQNYQTDLSENKIFYRKEYKSLIDKFEINKFKSSIDSVDDLLIDSLLQNLPKENSSATEVLSYYYGNLEEENQKINLIKSRETYKKDDEILESLNSKLEESLKKSLKSNSYFKIRSGLLPFSGDLEFDGLWDIDSTNQEALKKAKDAEIKRKENFANSIKGRISNIYSNLFYNDATDLDFILKSNRYELSSPELTYLGNQLVYVITFQPKGSKDYKGTLHINSDDFAVVRIDFKNVKSLFKVKLLGISSDNYLVEGRMVFSKLNNEKYSLTYFQVSSGSKAGIDRPFKIIEKNKFVKGRRKQNQISFNLDLIVNALNNVELRVFQSKPIDLNEFENLTEENKILPEYEDEFKTNFWEEF
ncbi:MAG: carboxypeptidase-like regulatory domain-containing protein [Cryomorphaceae bacterium]|nr:MAG: carboxypeptidase-like regulatory domain-containing protein [Cryomorphaceae bacterium]|tara:strand:- start:207 stop:1646 length:1440 start_codon:yes stop_codon:yes gene_type:complete